MDGKAIYSFAVTKIPKCIYSVIDKAGLTPDDISIIIPHQANLRILDAIASRTPELKDKYFINIEKWGNSSSGTISIAMADAIAQGKLKRGDVAIQVGFGAGLSWGAVLFKY